jgi:hypothetical protein
MAGFFNFQSDSFFFFFYNRSGPRPPNFRGLVITLRHTKLGRTPLDEWSARRRDLYLTTQNTHKRQTFMLPAGFEPTIPASEQPQNHALDWWPLEPPLYYSVTIPNFDTISSELRTTTSLRLGDLAENNERLGDVQSFETIFRYVVHFSCTVITHFV